MITKEQSKELYEQLTNQERIFVYISLHAINQNYRNDGFPVEIPHYVWAFNQHLFNTEEEGLDYIGIVDSDEFVIYTIYYLSRFAISKRK